MTIAQRIKLDLSLPVIGLALLYVSDSVTFIMLDGDRTAGAELLCMAAYLLGCSWWLWNDARTNHFLLPMNYGLLFLLATPVFVPIYLFQSRGWLACISLLLYGFVFLICIVAQVIAYFLLI